MTSRPILMSSPMVRAILREIAEPGTGKTQTRRVLDMPPMTFDAVFNDDGAWHVGDALTGHRYAKLSVRYCVGDRLYVREAWRVTKTLDDVAPRDLDRTTMPEWLASDPALYQGRKRPGMHLPRWATRLTLIVTDVRVQRLQEISEADAIAEGLERDIDGDVDGHGRHIVVESWRGVDYLPWLRDPIEAFSDLWEQINGARGFGWDANPWVAAYTFQPILGNIDQVRP